MPHLHSERRYACVCSIDFMFGFLAVVIVALHRVSEPWKIVCKSRKGRGSMRYGVCIWDVHFIYNTDYYQSYFEKSFQLFIFDILTRSDLNTYTLFLSLVDLESSNGTIRVFCFVGLLSTFSSFLPFWTPFENPFRLYRGQMLPCTMNRQKCVPLYGHF